MIEKLFRDWRLYVFGSLFLFNLFFALAIASPDQFPVGSVVEIKTGSTLAELARELETTHVVRSALWFRTAVILLGGEYGVHAGSYYLKNRETAVTLAYRMVRGDFGVNFIKVTIPEGYTDKQIASLFDTRFKNFDQQIFLNLADQGKMFPDTYFLPETITAGSAIDLFKMNYEKKIAPLRADIISSKKSEEQIITMASILEAEVKTPEDMAMVAGILWKRLDLGMPLQVDPQPQTYQKIGLPDKPLNNPGLNAINAAIHPTASDYLYFLSGKDGKTYYAKTLEEHIQNIKKYL